MRRAAYIIFQMAEVTTARQLFQEILLLIVELRPQRHERWCEAARVRTRHLPTPQDKAGRAVVTITDAFD